MTLQEKIKKLLEESTKNKAIQEAKEKEDEEDDTTSGESEGEDSDQDQDGVDDDEENKAAVDVKEHVDALLAADGSLSEDFKQKAATILEAAILDGVNKKAAALEEEYSEKLDEAVEDMQEAVVRQIDGYLDAIVEEWMKTNELAVERGVKAEILEGFVDGLKTLFAENYIEVPEEKVNVLDEQASTIEEMSSVLKESAEEIESLKAQLASATKRNLIESNCAGLAATEQARFRELCEDIEFADADSFVTKIGVIKETYFKGSKSTKSVIPPVDSPSKVIQEGTINKYAEALKMPTAFKR